MTAPDQGDGLPRGQLHARVLKNLAVEVFTDAKVLDIDQVVPLAAAWRRGAAEWTAAERRAYANDLGDERSLIAVTARSNRSKADQDVNGWLPPATGCTCAYITNWTTVKTRWGLDVDLGRPAPGALLRVRERECERLLLPAVLTQHPRPVGGQLLLRVAVATSLRREFVQ